MDVSNYFAGALVSIVLCFGAESVEGRSSPPQSSRRRIWQHVGDAPGWLARTVRPIVNANYWVQTRSAFLSASPIIRCIFIDRSQLSIALGVVIGALASPFTDFGLAERLWAGALAGFGAMGLFDLGKKMREI